MASCYRNFFTNLSNLAIIPTRILDQSVHLLPWLCFTFSTCNIFGTLIHPHTDPWISSLEATGYTLLLLLLLCIHKLAKVKNRLRIGFWTLVISLILPFTLKVSFILDSAAMSCIIWALGSTSIFLGLYASFIRQHEEEVEEPQNSHADPLSCNPNVALNQLQMFELV